MADCNRRKGDEGELAAVRFLERSGFVVLDRNYKRDDGEIDIIALDGGVLVFVEVKYREGSEPSRPSVAVDSRKRRRIVRTAERYVFENGMEDMEVRFDVFEIVSHKGRLFKHMIRGAFTGDC